MCYYGSIGNGCLCKKRLQCIDRYRQLTTEITSRQVNAKYRITNTSPHFNRPDGVLHRE
jgi:hypothetical protein